MPDTPTPIADLLLVGFIQGLLLSVVLLVKNPKPSSSRFWLGIFILSFALILLDNWGVATDLGSRLPIFHWTYYRVVSIAPLSFWFYLKKLNQHTIPYNLDVKIGWTIVSTELLVLAVIFCSRGYLVNQYYLLTAEFIEHLSILFTIGLLPLIMRMLFKFKTNPHNFSYDKLKKQYQWNKELMMLIALPTLVWVAVITTDLFVPSLFLSHNYIYATLCVTVFYVGVKGYLRPEIIHDTRKQANSTKLQLVAFNEANEPDCSAVQSTFSESELSTIEAIRQLMEEKKVYRTQKLSISDIAKQLNYSPKALSALINEYFNKNFNDFINTYRVKEVEHRLASGDHKKFAIVTIALDAGFNSKSSFYEVFKKLTGKSPTVYIQEME